MNKEISDLLLPHISKTVEYYEELYKDREFGENQVVTRFAPSPTGFVHFGSLYVSLVDKIVRDMNGGAFILRIEDTDKKREVENGIQGIIDSLLAYGITYDEGMISETEEKGNYGPYKQSDRKEIYQTYIKHLIENKLAYPCFCSEHDLEESRNRQESMKVRTGYYANYAKCRTLSEEQIKEKIANGEKFIIRFKSNGNYDKKIKYKDLIKGEIEFPENDQDIVIMKSDGLPTYHFAHVIDDHLMKTTHVIRGDEWISSVPLHIQLFVALGFKLPKFAHIAPIMKEEDGAKRKLSKRKDPEAAMSYYTEQGIPVSAVIEYLYNLGNSSFEEWRRQNPSKQLSEFDFKLNKMSVSGALFDHVKLLDVSKNIIAKMTAEEIYNLGLEWAKIYDVDLFELMNSHKEYTIALLNIERTGNKVRKDISKWSDLRSNLEYMYDEVYMLSKVNYEFLNINDKNEIIKILSEYLEVYDPKNSKEEWFNSMKEFAGSLGYAKEVKEYKANPEMFKGHVGDVSTVIRIGLTGQQNTPDLYELLKNLSNESIIARFDKCRNSL